MWLDSHLASWKVVWIHSQPESPSIESCGKYTLLSVPQIVVLIWLTQCLIFPSILYGDFDCYLHWISRFTLIFRKMTISSRCVFCVSHPLFQRLKMTSIHKYTLSFLDFRMFVFAERLIWLDNMCFITICQCLLIFKLFQHILIMKSSRK